MFKSSEYRHLISYQHKCYCSIFLSIPITESMHHVFNIIAYYFTTTWKKNKFNYYPFITVRRLQCVEYCRSGNCGFMLGLYVLQNHSRAWFNLSAPRRVVYCILDYLTFSVLEIRTTLCSQYITEKGELMSLSTFPIIILHFMNVGCSVKTTLSRLPFSIKKIQVSA